MGSYFEEPDLEQTPCYGGKATPLLKRKEQHRPLTRFKLLFRYFIVSFMVFAHIGSFIAYLGFKSSLYIREYKAILYSPWLLVILLCEYGYFLCSFIACIDLLLPPNINPKEPPPLSGDERDYPTVDILLPCCKEPTEVPVDSILAALAMDYPQDRFKVLVLDDGADDGLRARCEDLKAGTRVHLDYLCRSKVPGVPHHFKCGNLNFGLQHSNAEYIVMMDADMILHHSFLRALLPHIIHTPQVSFIQIPQAYYNLPIGDPLNDASISHYFRVLVQRNTLGFAGCVGTGAIFRREHLDLIGGFQPQSITEDTMTGFMLFNEGYKSVYLNKRLQIGLTPWTLEGYFKQRQRWCVGAIQQWSYSWKAMLGRKSKLDFLLKIFYFWHTGYYYISILNIAMLVVFVSALAFRLNLTVGDPIESRNLMCYLALYLVIWRLTWIIQWWGIPQQILSRNREESHFWWMTPFFLETLLQSVFAYKSTYNFVPTSSIDRNASKPNKSCCVSKLNQLKPLTFHLVYVCLVIVILCWQSYVAYTRGGIHNCREVSFIGGISIFLLTTCIHMLVPVFYVVWPTSFSPSLRRSLLKYDVNGVPQFSENDYIPKWHWPIVFYEAMSYATIAFWVGVLYVLLSEMDIKWCKH